jgi:chromosome partitioning protein
MRVIAVLNEKGGVGKTTTSYNLGGALAVSGKKVLLVDIDPQCNLTQFCGLKPNDNFPGDKTINEVLLDQISAKEAIVSRNKNLWVLPASQKLSDTEHIIYTKLGRELILADAMQDCGNFDFILIDCPPSLSLLTINALCFATELIVALQPEPASLVGLAKLLDTYGKIKTRMNKDLEISGIVCSMVESGKLLHREIIADIRSKLGDRVFQTVIPRRVAYTEASGQGKLINEYRPKSDEAKIVANLAKEVIKRKRK